MKSEKSIKRIDQASARWRFGAAAWPPARASLSARAKASCARIHTDGVSQLRHSYDIVTTTYSSSLDLFVVSSRRHLELLVRRSTKGEKKNKV